MLVIYHRITYKSGIIIYIPDCKWNEKLLLDIYVHYYKKSKIKKWSSVAEQYNKVCPGRAVDGESIRLKIRNLKERYQRLTKHNNTSGNDNKDIPEVLEDAFGQEVDLEAIVVESSRKKCELNSLGHVITKYTTES